jgi:hypothetical protein
MARSDDEDEHLSVIQCVDDPIVADTGAPWGVCPLQLPYARWARVIHQGCKLVEDVSLDGSRQFADLPRRRS